MGRRSRQQEKGAACCALLFISGIFTVGCRRDTRAEINVAPGVIFRRDTNAGIQLLDVDLQTAAVRPAIVAKNVERIRNNFVADAQTVRDWADENEAIGGLNAGFFGDTYDSVGRRKQIVGLAMVNSKVVAPGDFVASTKTPGERFLRSALGFADDGTPSITWATAALSGSVRQYEEPVNPPSGDSWKVRSAVACGPRLFANGKERLSMREERLNSPGKLSRAFVAYDMASGKPRHFILGRADGMEFTEVAAYLKEHFARVHQSKPQEAMCLDGGPSAQLVYRDNGRLKDAEATGVLVPTAILLLPKRQ